MLGYSTWCARLGLLLHESSTSSHSPMRPLQHAPHTGRLLLLVAGQPGYESVAGGVCKSCPSHAPRPTPMSCLRTLHTYTHNRHVYNVHVQHTGAQHTHAAACVCEQRQAAWPTLLSCPRRQPPATQRRQHETKQTSFVRCGDVQIANVTSTGSLTKWYRMSPPPRQTMARSTQCVQPRIYTYSICFWTNATPLITEGPGPWYCMHT